MRALVHAAAFVLAIAVVPAVASAQSAPEQAEARTLFDQGAQLYAAGDFAAACPKLEASLHLYAGLGTRGKLAECYEKLGRTASAWAMYEQVATLAAKAGDATREQVARERSAALAPKLARLTIVVPPVNDVPGLALKQNGVAVDRGAMGTAVPVDPGTLTFLVSATGHASKTVEVKVAPSQQVTFDVPALDVAPAAPTAAGTTDGAPSGGASATVAGSEATLASGTGNRWQTPLAIGLGGAGVVAIGVGAVLALTAKSSYDAAFSHGDCSHATLTCDSTGQSQTDGARSRANVGGALLGVGGALLVGGGVLFFTAPHGSAASALQLAPAVGPRTAGLSVAGGF